MNPTSLMLRWYRETTGGATPQPEQYTAEEVLQLLRPDQGDDSHTTPCNDTTPYNDADSALQDEVSLDVRPATTIHHDPARGAAVRAVASRPSAWLGRLSKQHRREIGELADRLPTLLFHHSIGGQPADLLRRYGGWSAWRFERALELAADCIARELNRGRLAA